MGGIQVGRIEEVEAEENAGKVSLQALKGHENWCTAKVWGTICSTSFDTN